jgi:phosphate transport system substrate-binding protein
MDFGERLVIPCPAEVLAMKSSVIVRVSVILIIGAALCVAAFYSRDFFPAVNEVKRDNSAGLNVGGSSVVFFIMDKWKHTYMGDKGVDIVYTSSGSAGGINNTIDKTYQIGFSSAPLTEKERKEAKAANGEVIQIPVVLIAVAPIYNVKELNELKQPINFTGEVLADIFLGKIKKWNDPALQKINEGVKLPDKEIIVVHREDASGTTFLFTEYLAGASEAWKKEMGPASNKVKWPVDGKRFIGIPRNYGVAGHVKRNDGTIGYVETLNAMTNKLKIGAIQNADKSAFLEAKPEYVTAAAKNLSTEALESGAFSLTNRPGKDAYPICGVEWAVCYQNQPAAQQKKVADFLHWSIHEGQAFTKELHYAPLSEELVQHAEKKIKSIKSAP